MSLPTLWGNPNCNNETFMRRERGYVQAYKYSTPKALHVWTPAGIAEKTIA
jgi:hypothetical protein